jgi:F420-non-reducing hydrogenase iron-sulfur subunit
VEGNLRARKRVERVKAILDDIGLSARRLTFFNIAPENSAAPADFLEKIASTLQGIGKNPAGKPNIPVSQRSQNAHALA